jgi:hypothetical protein
MAILLTIGAEGLIRFANQTLKIPNNVLYSIFISIHAGLILWGMASIWLFYRLL